jgi:hypothetical protein
VVWRTVARGPLFSAPFTFVGTEELQVGEATHRVRDFLAFTPGYKGEILDHLDALSEGGPVPESVAHAIDGLRRFVLGGVRDISYGELYRRIEVSRESGWDASRTSPAARELLAFCDAIPLTR